MPDPSPQWQDSPRLEGAWRYPYDQDRRDCPAAALQIALKQADRLRMALGINASYA
jgi:hypothetical protein